jgi:carbamoyltransferase
MDILGISCYYHDAAAVLLRDGELLAAAEEERFTRKKHDFGFPRMAIDFCLKAGGIKAGDLDYVVFYEKPVVKFERILTTVMGTYPASWRVFREAMIPWINEKLWVKGEIIKSLGVKTDKVLFVEHHLSHAASALFSSPFDEAAVLTIDGVGEWTTASMGHGVADWSNGNSHIDLDWELRFPHSLGLLYSAFTAFLGFQINEGEYKVMGMAPYGTPRYMDEVYRLVNVSPDGGFRLNMDYFSFTHSTEQSYNQKFLNLFGPARKPESEFYTTTTHPRKDHPQWDNTVAAQNQKYADIAASIQRVTEDIMVKMAGGAMRRTGSKKLVMAGGVALNSVGNGRILRETAVQDLYIQPAAGDSGGALGAALYAYHVLLGQPRKFVMKNAYYGQGYTPADVQEFLNQKGVKYERIEDDNRLTDVVVDALLKEKVVGWFQGRFEWGPRALGNRSILADPRRSEMKDLVNAKIKFREPFRPFAPAIIEEATADYFKMDDPARQYPARFMLLVLPIHPDKQEAIGAVNHLGTGRLQTVKEETNPNYYHIARKFGQATGTPVILNTSFNLRGEPIVTSPANAFWTFTNSGIDTLVMENYVVRKETMS